MNSEAGQVLRLCRCGRPGWLLPGPGAAIDLAPLRRFAQFIRQAGVKGGVGGGADLLHARGNGGDALIGGVFISEAHFRAFAGAENRSSHRERRKEFREYPFGGLADSEDGFRRAMPVWRKAAFEVRLGVMPWASAAS